MGSAFRAVRNCVTRRRRILGAICGIGSQRHPPSAWPRKTWPLNVPHTHDTHVVKQLNEGRTDFSNVFSTLYYIYIVACPRFRCGRRAVLIRWDVVLSEHL